MSSPESIREKKERMRRRLRARRQKMERERAIAASRKVCAHLSRRWSAPDVEHLAGYAALGLEINVRAFLKKFQIRGVDIYLPRVTGPGTMEFCGVDDFDALEAGSFGIDEPAGPAADSGIIEIFLVPGLAFDDCGHRLGFGMGYYDRALPDPGEALAVGVCYDWQLVDTVPAEGHDRPMDAVVTDAGWVRWDGTAIGGE